MIRTLKRAIFDGLTRQIAACNIRDTIVVAGAPRSGTTWLAEVLRALPSYKFVNEPLLLSNYEAAQKAGFAWRTHLAPNENAPQAKYFFEDVLSGRVPHGPLWHYQADSSVGRLLEQITHRKLIVKFCRAGRLLHWLLGEFEVRGAVLIVRHPCAVIASQLEHGGWDPDQLVHDIDSEEALGQMSGDVRLHFADVLDGISTRLELMTATWCLDYYIPLIEYAEYGHPWELVTYERLVLDGEGEMNRVLLALDAEMTDAVQEQLTVASEYASDDLKTSDSRNQLAKWRSRLSGQQIDRILDIVSAFGLDFYTRELEPNYSRIPGAYTALSE